MRKKRITIGMLSMMMAVTSVFGGVNVSAATPKLTANQVYDSTTMIKGKVKKGTTIKVKIGKKTIEKSEQKDNEKIKMWVVDQQASTKKELIGYECSCGAVKGK